MFRQAVRWFFLSLTIGCASGSPPPNLDAGPIGSADAGDGSVAIACAADAECDDGDACNGVESCVDLICAAGTPVSCSDGVTCTTDTCDPADGTCTSTPDDAACSVGLVCDPEEGCIAPQPCTADDECDDGVFCNGLETCEPAFGCRPGTEPACDDGVACTVDDCDATADACASTPSESICNDLRVCNGLEACDPSSPDADALGCVAGTTLNCADAFDCTVNECDEGAGGCTIRALDPAPCQDGTFCNGAEVCDATAGCIAGTVPDCADAVGCTIGRCDAALDRCVQDADPTFCNDGLVCNGTETCDTSGTTSGRGCVPGIAFDCSDGLACTTDMCSEPGTCTHGGSDADGDGYTAVGCGSGNDCNDTNRNIHPGAAEVCDGADNDCNGTADDGAGMQCALGSGPRACTVPGCMTGGTRTCTGVCTLTPCVAATETCNDCDDDGDGAIDNGLSCRRGTTMSCTTSCSTPGNRVCASDCSGYGSCTANEACNNCDDDGDGVADNGYFCRRGVTNNCTTACMTAGTQVCAPDCSAYGACRAASETCNGCDDDLNGTSDDGFACRQGATQSCTVPVCLTSGTRTCAADCSGYGACRAASETCNGCDDTGNGQIDEGFTCRMGETRSCTVCGAGGTQTCNGSCSGWGPCTAAEACNGCDDDGDGSADEDFACRQGATMSCTTCGTSAGVRTCNAMCTGYGACVATEVCNNCDDDADGTPDDGFACRMGTTQSCTVCGSVTGTQACNGTCTGYSACSATEVCNNCDDDADGTPDDGFFCRQNSTQSCTVCGGTGSQTCNGSCSAYSACSRTEVCNNCDDDADGTPDDGFTCAQGTTSSCTVCGNPSGTRTCNGTCTGYSACALPSEVCGNGCDDNANGMTDEGCGPPNDLFANAQALTVGASETTVTGNTTGAARDGSTVPCICTSSGNVWYRFTLSGTSAVYLDTQGSSYDTSIWITDSAGTPIAAQPSNGQANAGVCNDDAGCSTGGFGANDSRTWAYLTAGTYYVSVSGCATGAFTLHFQQVPITTGSYFYSTRFTGDTTTSTVLVGTSAQTSLCGGSASGEDVRWFTTCGGQAQFFSLCVSDGGTFSRSDGFTIWDPSMYIRSAQTGAEVSCNDDGPSMGGTNCVGTGGDSAQYGSRLNNIVVPRGLNTVFVDERVGGSGMTYTLRYTIR